VTLGRIQTNIEPASAPRKPRKRSPLLLLKRKTTNTPTAGESNMAHVAGPGGRIP